MACFQFLNFNPIDSPARREKDGKSKRLPNIKEMLTDILAYKETWETKQNEIDPGLIKKVKRTIFLEFLYRVQEGEKIGVADRETFEDICKTFLDENSQKEIQKKNTICSSSQPRDNETLERQSSQSSDDSLPDPDTLQEDIKSKPKQMSEQKLLETENLLRGYQFLQDDLKQISKTERKSFLGMIDVQHSIEKCHEIIMKGLIDPKKTGPGKFSTRPRSTDYRGETYHYPCYETKEIASAAIRAVVDQYHLMLDEIRDENDKEEQLKNSFKCASVLLFSFLALHPFSDGNGRLARLLCDRCLNTFCPFPSPIYNVFSPSTKDHYIEALVQGRKSLHLSHHLIRFDQDAKNTAIEILRQKPSELCSLIIESNWFMWRIFLWEIRLNKNLELFEFEELNTTFS